MPDIRQNCQLGTVSTLTDFTGGWGFNFPWPITEDQCSPHWYEAVPTYLFAEILRVEQSQVKLITMTGDIEKTCWFRAASVLPTAFAIVVITPHWLSWTAWLQLSFSLSIILVPPVVLIGYLLFLLKLNTSSISPNSGAAMKSTHTQLTRYPCFEQPESRTSKDYKLNAPR